MEINAKLFLLLIFFGCGFAQADTYWITYTNISDPYHCGFTSPLEPVSIQVEIGKEWGQFVSPVEDAIENLTCKHSGYEYEFPEGTCYIRWPYQYDPVRLDQLTWGDHIYKCLGFSKEKNSFGNAKSKYLGEFRVEFDGYTQCPGTEVLDSQGNCYQPVECTCNELKNTATNTCDPLPASTSYDPTTDSILEFELNNHGKSCDAINAGNTVGSCEANKQAANASVGNNATTGGNPIDCATGQKTQTDVDYVGAGLDPITVVRNYSTPLPPKPMSIEWSENHGWQAGMEPIVKLPAFNDDAIWQFHNVPRMRTKVFDDGAVLKQFQLGNGLTRAFFKGANDSDYQTSIVLRPAGYNATNNEHTVSLDSGEQYVFDANGLAKYKTNAQGTPIYFYEHSGTNLAKISNRFGRFVSFDYDLADRVKSITDQDGVQIRYGYDGDNLTQVIYPDNTPTDMSDNPTKHYVYDDANFSKYLTGIINGNGERYATFAYNDQGQAISTEHHNGAERVEVSYPDDGKAVVKFYRDTAANAYREEHYQYGKFRGRYRLTQKQITQCDNCALTTESWLYNDRELLTRHTSPEGIVTEYGYDTQDRKVSETRGAGTPEASTTTYTWNDTHNQIETITTATDVTTYTFDVDGNRINTTVTPVQ